MRKVNLDKISQKLQEVEDRGTKFSTSSDNIWWKPQGGANYLRVLPPWKDSIDYFYREVWWHYRVGPMGKSFVCLDKEQKGPCFLCEEHIRLRNSSDPEQAQRAGDLRPTYRVMANVVDRNNEDAGVQVYTFGSTVFKAMLSYFSDPDYGDITDVDNGVDLIIEKTGEKLETRYKVRAKRNSSKLSDDQDTINMWLTTGGPKGMHDLDALSATKSYTEMKAAYEGVEAPSTSDAERMEAQKSKAAATSASKPSRGVPNIPKAVKEEESSDSPPWCFGNDSVFGKNPACPSCKWEFDCEEDISSKAKKASKPAPKKTAVKEEDPEEESDDSSSDSEDIVSQLERAIAAK